MRKPHPRPLPRRPFKPSLESLIGPDRKGVSVRLEFWLSPLQARGLMLLAQSFWSGSREELLNLRPKRSEVPTELQCVTVDALMTVERALTLNGVKLPAGAKSPRDARRSAAGSDRLNHEAPSVMPAGLLLLWNGDCSEALRFFPGGSMAEFDIEAFISQLAGLVSPRSACPQCAGRQDGRAVIPLLTAALPSARSPLSRSCRSSSPRSGRGGRSIRFGSPAAAALTHGRDHLLISSSNCWAFAFAAVCSACVPEEKAAARHLYCFCCFAVIAARSDLPLSHPRS
jgi:hypothetical protein